MITVVGDSITWGLNHCTAEEIYCALLTQNFAHYFTKTKILRYDGIPNDESVPILKYHGPVNVQGGTEGRITVVRCGVGGNTVRRALNRVDNFAEPFITGELPNIYNDVWHQ